MEDNNEWDFLQLSPLKRETVPDAQVSAAPSLEFLSVYSSLWEAAVPPVSLLEPTGLHSNGGWHSMSSYSHLVKSSVIFVLFFFPFQKIFHTVSVLVFSQFQFWWHVFKIL